MEKQRGFVPLIFLLIFLFSVIGGAVIYSKNNNLLFFRKPEPEEIVTNPLDIEASPSAEPTTPTPVKSKGQKTTTSKKTPTPGKSGPTPTSSPSSSNNNQNNNNQSSSDPTSTPGPSSVTPIGYHISESPIPASQTSPTTNATAYPLTVDYHISDSLEGTKTIFVRFFYSNGNYTDKQQSFIYRPDSTTPTPELGTGGTGTGGTGTGGTGTGGTGTGGTGTGGTGTGSTGTGSTGEPRATVWISLSTGRIEVDTITSELRQQIIDTWVESGFTEEDAISYVNGLCEIVICNF